MKATFLLPLAVLVTLSAHAQDFFRNALRSDKETPVYMLGSVRERWTGGQIAWYYNPANQPGNLTTVDVINAIKNASARWVGMCNLSFTYMGTTTVPPNVRSTSTSAPCAGMMPTAARPCTALRPMRNPAAH